MTSRLRSRHRRRPPRPPRLSPPPLRGPRRPAPLNLRPHRQNRCYSEAGEAVAMKLLLVCGLGVLSSFALVTQLAAQGGGAPPGHSGPRPILRSSSTSGAFGGSCYGSGARTNPLGGVALPTFGNPGNRRRQPVATIYPYVAPLYYSPLSYDAGYDYSAGYSQTPPPGYGSAAPAPPVIINQYFAAPRPDDQPRVSAPAAGPDDASSPGDPLGGAADLLPDRVQRLHHLSGADLLAGRRHASLRHDAEHAQSGVDVADRSRSDHETGTPTAAFRSHFPASRFDVLRRCAVRCARAIRA